MALQHQTQRRVQRQGPRHPAYQLAVAAGAVLGMALLVLTPAWAHFGPKPVSLQGITPPAVPGLVDGPNPIVTDAQRAIVLGKALFWDQAVGSDGIACASCHFQAGADGRVRNQLAPSGRDPVIPTVVFDTSPSGEPRGPNHTLTPEDFPFHQRSDPLNPVSSVTYESDDVVASSGSFGGEFLSAAANVNGDVCDRTADPLFQVQGTGTRKVMSRHAPTVINAAFSYRQLWDGAANNIFNGSSPWGPRDPDAGMWVVTSPSEVEHQSLTLENSALASQAVSPVVSDIEMSCASRSFNDVGRKLIERTPLATQKVHWNDSVLGADALSVPGQSQPGLNTTYGDLIRESFDARYWSHTGVGVFGAPTTGNTEPYTQIEANFALFFGLSIQLYLETLISDQSPFDLSAKDENGVPTDLSESAQAGFEIFRTAHCNLCHIGPVFTSAAVETNAFLVEQDPEAFGNETFAVSTSSNVLTRLSLLGGSAFVDTGFAATGVTPDGADPGLGGSDPFGHPLSFSAQYLQLLAGQTPEVVDPPVFEVRPCDLDLPIARNEPGPHPIYFTEAEGVAPQSQPAIDCFFPDGAYVPLPSVALAELQSTSNTRMREAATHAFKIPTLRNVELTAPYMHDGSMATLEQVIEFYTRGGNHETTGKHFGTVFPQLDLRFDPSLRQALLDFLISLTDERVRYEQAPFDHPELIVPHGHSGNDESVSGGHPLGIDLARDDILWVPAVGAGGLSAPRPTFQTRLTPEPNGTVLLSAGLMALVALVRRKQRIRSSIPL